MEGGVGDLFVEVPEDVVPPGDQGHLVDLMDISIVLILTLSINPVSKKLVSSVFSSITPIKPIIKTIKKSLKNICGQLH